MRMLDHVAMVVSDDFAEELEFRASDGFEQKATVVREEKQHSTLA